MVVVVVGRWWPRDGAGRGGARAGGRGAARGAARSIVTITRHRGRLASIRLAPNPRSGRAALDAVLRAAAAAAASARLP